MMITVSRTQETTTIGHDDIKCILEALDWLSWSIKQDTYKSRGFQGQRDWQAGQCDAIHAKLAPYRR